MANTLPLNIPIPQSAAIASFNYTDIAEGTGVIAFYGSVWTSGGTDYPPETETSYYYLTTNQVYSDRVAVSGASIAGGGAGYVKQNVNFDVVFNRTQNFKGMAYLNLTIGGYRPAGGSSPYLWLSGANLQNATTSTIISNTITSEPLEFVTTPYQTKTILLQLNLSGGVTHHFKPGEVLRLHFDVWGTGGSTAGLNYGGFGADPRNRADPLAGVTSNATLSGANTTQLVLYIPALLNTV